MRTRTLNHLCLAAALSCAAPLSAQSNFRVDLGVMGGVNFASFGGSDADFETVTAGTKTGFIGGGFATLRFGKVFSIEPEVLYSMEGTTYEEGGNKLTFSYDVIEVPILFRAGIPLSGTGVMPFVFAGPAVGFKVGCTIGATIGSSEESQDCEEGDFASVDFDAVFGLGVEVPVTKRMYVNLSGRYTLGLTTLDDTGIADVKNQVWSVTAGLGFRLGK